LTINFNTAPCRRAVRVSLSATTVSPRRAVYCRVTRLQRRVSASTLYSVNVCEQYADTSQQHQRS